MKKIWIPTLVLFLICLAVAALLFGANALTAERIAAAEAEALVQAAKDVLPQAVRVEPIEMEGVDGYYGYDGEGELVGYSLRASAKGYGGDVITVVGVDTEGKIVGVVVNGADETPGLGSKVQKPKFTDRFLGLILTDGLDREALAITGASYSSEAVLNGIEQARGYYELLKGEDAQ